MKLRFQVEFEVENDWDEMSFMSDRGAGRKQVVGKLLRRDTMAALGQTTAMTMIKNGVAVFSMTVSEPEWIGWDNQAISEELAVEASDDAVIADVEALVADETVEGLSA